MNERLNILWNQYRQDVLHDEGTYIVANSDDPEVLKDFGLWLKLTDGKGNE
jgi:hypothetical protein